MYKTLQWLYIGIQKLHYKKLQKTPKNSKKLQKTPNLKNSNLKKVGVGLEFFGVGTPPTIYSYPSKHIE